MKCTYSIEDLEGYLDGLMCDREKEKLHKHLEICEDCRNHLGILKLTEGHIKEEVQNDGSTYLRVMESIDKNRYQGEKSRYRIGGALFKLKPYLKPLAAAVLIMIIAVAALNNQQHIKNVLSSIEEMVSENKENVEDNNKKEEKASRFFKAEPVSELKKGTPSADGWVASEERVLKGVGDNRETTIKLYVKPEHPNSSSSRTTGEVMAYVEDNGDLYEIGLVSNYGTIDMEFKAQDLNNDGKNEISIKGQMGASSIAFKVIGWEQGKWVKLLDTDYTEVMDLDSDGDVELVCTSVGSTPPYVWIYRWNGGHFEKMDVAEATGNEYASLLNRGTTEVMLESGSSNEKHCYRYKDGELIEDKAGVNKIKKDNVSNINFNTCVTRDVWGKKGPGEDFEDIIKIPYGRVIRISGMYMTDGGNSGWYIAALEPELKDDRSKIILPENQTEFYIKFDSIVTGNDHAVNFDECTVNDALKFNCVITGGNRKDGTVCLKQRPDEKSPTVSIADKGNLIYVIRKDKEWSLVKIISSSAMEDYSDIGWLKNEYYSEYKPGMKVNQGFIVKPFRIYEKPDVNSNYPPLDSGLKSNIAPVTIIETDTNTKSGWSIVRAGFNGVAGWVKTEDIKFSFTSEEANKLMNPDVDLELLTQKIKEEIDGWEDLSLCALDIDKKIKLSSRQRKELAGKLTGVTGYEVFDGGLSSYREAVYPFYVLKFSEGSDDSYIYESLDEPPLKYYRSSFSKFNFIAVGDDKLLIQIPSEKLKAYGLYREGAPVKFIKVNREFINYFKTLIPVPANNDKNSFNYLLNAITIEVDGGVKEKGIEPQQVCETARIIKAFAGDEFKPKKEPDAKNRISEFKFTFSDGSTERVLVFENCLMYKGRYYSLNGPPNGIEGTLFAAYF